MAGQVEPGSSTTHAPRRAVRPPRILLVLAAIVFVMVGRGLGVFGSAPAGSAQGGSAPVGGDNANTTPATASAPSTPTPAAPDPEPPPRPLAEAPRAEPPVATERSKPVTKPGGVDADRFASLVSLVHAQVDGGRLGSAAAALERTRALPLDDAQRDRVTEQTHAVEQALATAVERIRELLGHGQVLATRDLTDGLLADAPAAVRTRVAAAFGDAALDPARPAAVPQRPWPIPRPLARDRVVRVRGPEGPSTGRVVDSRSDQITLRVEREQSVTFPTLPVSACEPVDPSAEEAVEMGFAALQAGDALLARLWLECARCRGPATGERVDRLGEALR